MSSSGQVITRGGVIFALQPNERILIDPDLRDANGNRVAFHIAAIAAGQAEVVAYVEEDGVLALFEIQSTAPFVQDFISWGAFHLHSLQAQDPVPFYPNTVGPSGARPSPNPPAQSTLGIPYINHAAGELLLQDDLWGTAHYIPTGAGPQTLTLPPTPIDRSWFRVIVPSGINDVTVDGNGKTINGSPTVTFPPSVPLAFHFNGELDGWFTIVR